MSALVFSLTILCALGSIEALMPKPWFPIFAKEVVNDKPISKEATVLGCGDHVLEPGQAVLIKSPDKFPKNYKCIYNFTGPVDSEISITCTKFVLGKCKKTSLTVTGGDFSKKYCGKKPDGFTASSTNNNLKVVFKSKLKKTNQVFQCLVCASVPPVTTTPTTTTPATGCTCGQMNTMTRIIGGSATQVHQYPWQVALTEGNNTEPYCSGSILSDQWILTAVQCVQNKSLDDLRVVVGEHNWNDDTETTVTERLEVSEVVIHPNYTSPIKNNNLALVKLLSPIIFKVDNKIAPICLPPPDLYEEVDAIITGWGAAAPGGGMENELHEVTVPTWTVDKCTSTYGSFMPVDDVICTGPSDDTKDYCNGDLGGALVTAGDPNGTYMVQIGLASVDLFCPFSHFPGFYTRVNSFLYWIWDHIDGTDTCMSIIP